jgi:hypothetical protein
MASFLPAVFPLERHFHENHWLFPLVGVRVANLDRSAGGFAAIRSKDERPCFACGADDYCAHALLTSLGQDRQHNQRRRETTMTLTWIAKRLNMGASGSLANMLRHAKRKQ